MIARIPLAAVVYHCVYAIDKRKLAGDIDGTCPGPPDPEEAHSMEGHQWAALSCEDKESLEDEVVFLQKFTPIEKTRKGKNHDVPSISHTPRSGSFGRQISSLEDDVMLVQTSPPIRNFAERKLHDGSTKDFTEEAFPQRKLPFPVLSSQSNTLSEIPLYDRHGRGDFRKQAVQLVLNSTDTTGNMSSSELGPHRHRQGARTVDAHTSHYLKELEGKVTALFEVAREQLAVHTSSSTKASAGAVIVLIVVLILLLATIGAALYFRSSRREGNQSGTKLLSEKTHASQNPPMMGGGSQSFLVRPGSAELNRPASLSALPLSTPKSRGLPPICPSLIMPMTEARFMIPMQELTQIPPDGRIKIIGTSGRTLLSLSISESSAGLACMSLASVNCDDDPRMRILMTPANVQGPLIMEVYKQTDTFYGTLEIADRASPTKSVLKYKGQPVMHVEVVDVPEMRINAENDDGLLGAGGRQTHPHLRTRHVRDGWKLVVKPGEDAILITACMLAMILMVPGIPSPPPIQTSLGR